MCHQHHFILRSDRLVFLQALHLVRFVQQLVLQLAQEMVKHSPHDVKLHVNFNQLTVARYLQVRLR